ESSETAFKLSTVDHVQAALAFARLPRPRGAAGRMAGRVNHLQLQLSDVDRLARAECLDRAHGGIRLDDLELRIAAIDLARSQHFRGDIARDDLRNRALFSLCDNTRV